MTPFHASVQSLPSLFFVNRSDRGRLQLTGRDRQSFLQGMVTNDVAKLTPGEGCYAFMLQATGQVIGDMRVLCAENSLLLDVEPNQAAFVAQTLDKYLITEKCRITDVSETMGQILVGGTDAPTFFANHFGVSGREDWTEGQNAPIEIAGTPTSLVARTPLIGPPAYEVYLTPTPQLKREDTFHAALRAAGATELSADDLDVLRIEAGVPRFGVDIDSTVLAPETGQAARAISYRKGCYIGQEIVARIHARGHTNRAFVGFCLSGDEPTPLPIPGTPVATEENPTAGRITSATFSPLLGCPIALGYIRHEFAAPDTMVTVGGQYAQVSALPFAEVAAP